MPPVTRRAPTVRPSPSPSAPDAAADATSSTLPTLSTIPLPPRRTLRDGTAASSRTRGSSFSGSTASSRASSQSRQAASGSRAPRSVLGGQGITRQPQSDTAGSFRAAGRVLGDWSGEGVGHDWSNATSSAASSPERDDPADLEYVPRLEVSPLGGIAIRGRAKVTGSRPARLLPRTDPSSGTVRRTRSSLSPRQALTPLSMAVPTPPQYDPRRAPRVIPHSQASATGLDRTNVPSQLNANGTRRTLLEALDDPDSLGSQHIHEAAGVPPQPAESPLPLPPARSGVSSSSSSTSSSSSSPLALEQTGSSSDSSIVELDSDTGGRRYTRAEKGKGRAGVISVGDSPIMLTKELGLKRKAADGDTEVRKRSGALGSEKEALEVDDVEGLDEYSCPVCFSSPSRPVSTLCGHVMCADCLHASLLAAIGRQPNPLPSTHLGPGPAPRPRFVVPTGAATTAGAGGRTRPLAPATIRTRSKAHPDTYPTIDSTDSQPVEWTHTTLVEQVIKDRQAQREKVERAAEKQFKEAGMAEENWSAAKISMGLPENVPTGPGTTGWEEDQQLVVELLKGLWKVPGGHVIEGECPVCRNAIPGGMGPLGSGIGSVMPISAWLEY